ncbi:virulence RhuM family protein [Candidatus Uhrbacteria bacterium]|nr:virulence RhuM family protein [Candidatus Uhrbacteria bacterium]
MEQQNTSGSILLYERKDGIHFEVMVADETIWMSQQQIANLFVVKKAAVSKHIKHIYADTELLRNGTVSKMETVQREGGRFIKRKIEYYHLDMIIAVGYRVNSRHATRFRIWATKVLRDHIMKGYTVNQHRLKQEYEGKLQDLEKTIVLLQEALKAQK